MNFSLITSTHYRWQFCLPKFGWCNDCVTRTQKWWPCLWKWGAHLGGFQNSSFLFMYFSVLWVSGRSFKRFTSSIFSLEYSKITLNILWKIQILQCTKKIIIIPTDQFTCFKQELYEHCITNVTIVRQLVVQWYSSRLLYCLEFMTCWIQCKYFCIPFLIYDKAVYDISVPQSLLRSHIKLFLHFWQSPSSSNLWG